MTNSLQWPEELWPVADVLVWLMTTADSLHVEGPVQLHNVKKWGVTAEFSCDHEPVIFKGCKLPLFAKRTQTELLLARGCADFVPELLACRTLPHGETWTLHRAFRGIDVEQTGKFENVLAMARTLAEIQVTVAKLPRSAKAALPYTSVKKIPEMFDYMVKRIEEQYLAAWLANDAKMLHEYALPYDVVEQIKAFRLPVAAWTREFIDGNWPVTLDHLDFNISNAAVQENGKVIIFDWEEAILSAPFLSISRLLDDADRFEADPANSPRTEGQLQLTPNQMAIRHAYIDALPWQRPEARARAFDLAICLAPVKTAYECELFNEALRRENGLPQLAAHCFANALRFWQAMIL